MKDLFESPDPPLAKLIPGENNTLEKTNFALDTGGKGEKMLNASWLMAKNSELILLTGSTGSGKTSWCMQLIESARARRKTVAGLISPPVISAGNKIGIDLLDLTTGERHRLAVPRESTARGLVTDEWQFNPLTLEWGEGVLRALHDCDLFILDELGPLEFKLDRGLKEGLSLLDTRRFPLACVVVRPSLLSIAKERWPWGNVVDLTAKSTSIKNIARVRK